jgi:hypothetical protein
MPEDKVDELLFKVTDHPMIDEKDRIYISWFDIQVRYKGELVCDIVVNCVTGIAYYFFESNAYVNPETRIESL